MNTFAPNFPPLPTDTAPLVRLTHEALEMGLGHDAAMKGMSLAEQVQYMHNVVRGADAVLAVFLQPGAVLGQGLLVVKGADVLRGAGVDLHIVECRGRHPAMRHRRLDRDISIEAFTVPSYEDACRVDLCWGDSRGAMKNRIAQRRDGGDQAVYNMRTTVTPYGRAWLAANKDYVNKALAGR